MDARIAVQSFVKRWLNNKNFHAWPPAIAFQKLSEHEKRAHYEKGHARLRAMAWEMFQDVSIGAAAREEMCWIMAVGLWEKDRREREAAQKVAAETPAVWAARAERRVRDRLANRVPSMPLTARDAAVYMQMIEKVRGADAFSTHSF